jgi:hypothetical protein
LRRIATTKNDIHEELKIRQHSWNYRNVRVFFCPGLLSETAKMKMVVVKYGCMEGSAGEDIVISDTG